VLKASFIGIDQFKSRIESAKKEIKDEVDAEVMAAAMEFAGLAKRDLNSQPGYRGVLKNSIQIEKQGDMAYRVYTDVFYAPFIEFGTKSKFVAQTGFEEEAAQFRGLRGSGAVKLIDAITEWVRVKGIATGKEINRVSFLIARSIYKNGISPQPFFYKHVAPVRENLNKRLKAIFDGI
jgi:HK97 gp10 family phage protein